MTRAIECLMGGSVVWGEGRSNREFQHLGAGHLANFEPFGTVTGRMVRRKEF